MGGAGARQMGLPLQLVLQMGPEALWDESVALQWWRWRAQQLKAGRNDAGAASRWQCAEPGWPTSALGMLEWLPSHEQGCSEML